MGFLHSLVSTITSPIRTLFFWFSQCMPGIRFISRWSLPTKWAWLVFLFLLINWFAAIANLQLDEERSGMDWMKYVIAPAILLVAIPIAVYFFVVYLLMEQKSKYPDIDRIWTEGIDQAAEKGILLNRTPLFLVLGIPTHRESKALVQLLDFGFAVSHPGSGEPPISLHACDRGIFLFLNGCNCVSRLSTTSSTTSSAGGAAAPAHVPAGDEGAHPGGTIDASALRGFQSEPEPVPMSPIQESPSPAAMAQPGGTMLWDDTTDLQELLQPAATSRMLSSQEVFDCEEKLRHVCHLIRKARGALCPINGIVTALPLGLIESSSNPLQIAIQKDLAVLRREFQVRCSNTALVIGMENEPGFVEFMKRLPAQQLTEHRIGKGCELWAAPEQNRMEAVAIHATGTFEDWIYTLFQADNALKSRNNSRLFALLCRIRGAFGNNLKTVLGRGFGFDPHTEPQLAYEQFLFSGCYFSAIGSTSNLQAFAKSVFSKTMELEGDLDWSPGVRKTDSQYHFFANLSALLGTIAILAIAAMLIHHFWFRDPSTTS